ncbi:MAG: UDP-N-acetylglucosamine 2-epimerase (non-hydrolyzing) [Acidobacteria bacterium]|nr:UDP-N-acetylglucosamine 2-epimerase (non-hydrolyzing) [Acidobacteriota bacterium]
MVSVFLVGGARPNFMKIAPLYHAFRKSPTFDVILVNTGQHYDDRMAGSFFRELGLPEPDISLDVRSGSHAAQTARILERFEEQLVARQPHLVVVVGDVNSTIACALAASKLTYPGGGRPLVAHVEAGLRSFDRGMPEEINRLLTDAISDFLFVTEPAGVENLRREGRSDETIFMVGNVMIDSLLAQARNARARQAWKAYGVTPRRYAVATLHRPSNVDDPERLGTLIEALEATAEKLPVIFPIHPRTRARLEQLRASLSPQLMLCEPQPYTDFLSLMADARLVLTDSGGIQEETTILGVPCLTLRANTERPITVEAGTNRLIGMDPEAIGAAVADVLARPMPAPSAPPLWDGAAAPRIVECLENHFKGRTPAGVAGAVQAP